MQIIIEDRHNLQLETSQDLVNFDPVLDPYSDDPNTLEVKDYISLLTEALDSRSSNVAKLGSYTAGHIVQLHATRKPSFNGNLAPLAIHIKLPHLFLEDTFKNTESIIAETFTEFKTRNQLELLEQEVPELQLSQPSRLSKIAGRIIGLFTPQPIVGA